MTLVPPSSHQQTPNQPGAGLVYTQTTDPGAVGAGAIWVNTTAISGTAMRPALVRNAANNAWIPSGIANYVSGVLRGFITIADDGGIAIESCDGAGSPKSIVLVMNDLIILTGNPVRVDAALTLEAALIVPNIPTADPHVAGQFYSTAGVVHVSAG